MDFLGAALGISTCITTLIMMKHLMLFVNVLEDLTANKFLFSCNFSWKSDIQDLYYKSEKSFDIENVEVRFKLLKHFKITQYVNYFVTVKMP